MSKPLRALAKFLPALENPDFKAGEMAGIGEQVAPGVWSMPYADYGAVASKFMDAAYKHGWVMMDFDWPVWSQSEEAYALRDDEAKLAAATPEQLWRLLTVVIRQERFAEGAVLGAFESGLILGIVRRAAALLAAAKGQ